MKQGLQEINNLDGVWGSMVCSNQGEIISSAPPSGIEPSELEEISHLCVETLSDGSEFIEGLGEMTFFYQQKHLFVLDLKNAVMIVFCTPSIDVSLLRLTINLVTTRWKEENKM